MSYNVVAVPEFRRELKRLAKKYHSLKAEISILIDELAEKPKLGTPLGNNVYKIRLSISSKGKGRRGGARVITYVEIDDYTVLLLSIYNKGEKQTISDKEIKELLDIYTK